MRMTTAGGEPLQADVSGIVIELNLLLGDDRTAYPTKCRHVTTEDISFHSLVSHQTFTFLSSLEFFLTL